VDATNDWMGKAAGCLANQVFTPHTVGDDGFTISIWRDDPSMFGERIFPASIGLKSTDTRLRTSSTVVRSRASAY
jgi:hypothetical protein